MTHFWNDSFLGTLITTSIRILYLGPTLSYLNSSSARGLLESGDCDGVVGTANGAWLASSLLLRIRFSGFTHVFSLAMEDLISLLGGVVFATLMSLGTSSLG